MTGPEHYAEAERLLDHAPTHGISNATGLDRAESFATAQVHATLALAAATIDTAYPPAFESEWDAAIRGGA